MYDWLIVGAGFAGGAEIQVQAIGALGDHAVKRAVGNLDPLTGPQFSGVRQAVDPAEQFPGDLMPVGDS